MYQQIEAKELRLGDELYLRFMGGSETIRINNVTIQEKEILWAGYNMVTGEMSDYIPLDAKVTIKD